MSIFKVIKQNNTPLYASTQSYRFSLRNQRIFKKDDAHSAMYSIITCLVLPIPKPESTMSSTIGRKVHGLTIPRCSIGMVKRAG